MGYDFLYEVEDGVATITFDRPDKINALPVEIYWQLRELRAELRRDDQVRVVIITGAGRAFCAGGDLYKIIEELLERDMRSHLDFARLTGALIQNMRLLDKPIISAVNGIAAGAGAVIALASDLRVASAKAI